MTVLTPTTSLEAPQSVRVLVLRNFSALRPTIGTVVRFTADVTSLVVAFLFGWLVVEGRTIISLMQETSTVASLIGVLSILACIAYTGMGLYAQTHSTSLLTKVTRICVVNFSLFAATSVILTLTQQSAVLTIGLLSATFIGSIIPLSMARVALAALRSEERQAGDARYEVADEQKVLLIGGGGYIGSSLVEKLLTQGFHVSVLDALHFGEQSLSSVAGHPNLTIIREDFRRIEVLTRAMSGVGSVIHLGGLVGDPACAVDADLTVDVNVTATKVVGQIAKARGVRRFIFASSCSVYGASDELMDERSHFNPQSLYARSKVASEAALGELNDRDFAVTCLRFATIYGISGRMRFDLVVNLLCAKAVHDGKITVFGGDQWRPFVHVDDIARALAMTLRAPVELVAGEAFNVGSDAQNYTLDRVAELIQMQVPEAEITSDDTFVDRRNYRVSFEKIRSVLGFEPAWTIERGISQVIAAVRSNRVGHYSQPTYSNVLYLRQRGANSFGRFKITGWENELMNLDQIASTSSVNKAVA